MNTASPFAHSLKAGLALSAAISLLAGCSSMTVNNNDLTQRTSLALGLTPERLTISNRTDSGIRTDYIATTHSNETYACYVTGMVSVMGRTVSDAVCTRMNGQDAHSAAPSGSQPARPCNALLQAAGKCN